MTRDEVIEIWGNANGWSIKEFNITITELERFAQLVAEREREACAAMAEAFHHHQYDFTGDLELHEAIRARGAK